MAALYQSFRAPVLHSDAAEKLNQPRGGDASFYIGEAGPEESRHAIEEALAVWNGCVGPRTRATALGER